jgi:hypothetical protein
MAVWQGGTNVSRVGESQLASVERMVSYRDLVDGSPGTGGGNLRMSFSEVTVDNLLVVLVIVLTGTHHIESWLNSVAVIYEIAMCFLTQ